MPNNTSDEVNASLAKAGSTAAAEAKKIGSAAGRAVKSIFKFDFLKSIRKAFIYGILVAVAVMAFVCALYFSSNWFWNLLNFELAQVSPYKKYNIEDSLRDTIVKVYYAKFAQQSYYYVIDAPDDKRYGEVDYYTGVDYDNFDEHVDEGDRKILMQSDSSTGAILQDPDNYDRRLQLSISTLSLLDNLNSNFGQMDISNPAQFLKPVYATCTRDNDWDDLSECELLPLVPVDEHGDEVDITDENSDYSNVTKYQVGEGEIQPWKLERDKYDEETKAHIKEMIDNKTSLEEREKYKRQREDERPVYEQNRTGAFSTKYEPILEEGEVVNTNTVWERVGDEKMLSVSDWGLGSILHYQAYFQPSIISNYKFRSIQVLDPDYLYGNSGNPIKDYKEVERYFSDENNESAEIKLDPQDYIENSGVDLEKFEYITKGEETLFKDYNFNRADDEYDKDLGKLLLSYGDDDPIGLDRAYYWVKDELIYRNTKKANPEYPVNEGPKQDAITSGKWKYEPKFVIPFTTLSHVVDYAITPYGKLKFSVISSWVTLSEESSTQYAYVYKRFEDFDELMQNDVRDLDTSKGSYDAYKRFVFNNAWGTDAEHYAEYLRNYGLQDEVVKHIGQKDTLEWEPAKIVSYRRCNGEIVSVDTLSCQGDDLVCPEGYLNDEKNDCGHYAETFLDRTFVSNGTTPYYETVSSTDPLYKCTEPGHWIGKSKLNSNNYTKEDEEFYVVIDDNRHLNEEFSSEAEVKNYFTTEEPTIRYNPSYVFKLEAQLQGYRKTKITTHSDKYISSNTKDPFKYIKDYVSNYEAFVSVKEEEAYYCSKDTPEQFPTMCTEFMDKESMDTYTTGINMPKNTGSSCSLNKTEVHTVGDCYTNDGNIVVATKYSYQEGMNRTAKGNYLNSLPAYQLIKIGNDLGYDTIESWEKDGKTYYREVTQEKDVKISEIDIIPLISSETEEYKEWLAEYKKTHKEHEVKWITYYSSQYGVDPALLYSLMYTEMKDPDYNAGPSQLFRIPTGEYSSWNFIYGLNSIRQSDIDNYVGKMETFDYPSSKVKGNEGNIKAASMYLSNLIHVFKGNILMAIQAYGMRTEAFTWDSTIGNNMSAMLDNYKTYGLVDMEDAIQTYEDLAWYHFIQVNRDEEEESYDPYEYKQEQFLLNVLVFSNSGRYYFTWPIDKNSSPFADEEDMVSKETIYLDKFNIVDSWMEDGSLDDKETRRALRLLRENDNAKFVHVWPWITSNNSLFIAGNYVSGEKKDRKIESLGPAKALKVTTSKSNTKSIIQSILITSCGEGYSAKMTEKQFMDRCFISNVGDSNQQLSSAINLKEVFGTTSIYMPLAKFKVLPSSSDGAGRTVLQAEDVNNKYYEINGVRAVYDAEVVSIVQERDGKWQVMLKILADRGIYEGVYIKYNSIPKLTDIHKGDILKAGEFIGEVKKDDIIFITLEREGEIENFEEVITAYKAKSGGGYGEWYPDFDLDDCWGSGNPYEVGQCTWFVFGMIKQMYGIELFGCGNGSDFAGNAIDIYGFEEGVMETGAVVSASGGQYGHTFIFLEDLGDKIYILEANFNGLFDIGWDFATTEGEGWRFGELDKDHYYYSNGSVGDYTYAFYGG